MHLKDEITKHFRLTKYQKSALQKLGLNSVQDLLYHFPHRYENPAEAKHIKDIQKNENVILYGKIENVDKRLSWKTKKYVLEAELKDASGSLKLMWFNQIYMEKVLENKPYVKVQGKVTGKKTLYIANPNIEVLPSLPQFIEGQSELLPIYHESKGISSRWFYFAIKKVLENIKDDEFSDPIPAQILRKYNLPHLKKAIYWAHFPTNKKQAIAAQKRFAFEEVFALQVLKQKEKLALQKKRSVKINISKRALEKLEEFIQSFGFELTGAQRRAIQDIIEDFKKPYPSQRLLEVDVGSGKTAVAAAASYLVFLSQTENNKYKSLQTAYMAPTEILANQIFDEFIKFFNKESRVKIGLVTSSGYKIYPSKTEDGATKISCTQLKKWIKEGIVPIVVGTHALIFKSVEFENLAFVIVDEQHRFGTKQRQALARKDGAEPYLLSMSATPIPRTLALTIYGDLELSVLDELPKGRKEIQTKIVPKKDREKIYEFVRKELDKGRQAYVICPRIEEPDPEKANALRAKSVEEELKRLSEGPFKNYRLAPLHGKMKAKEKDEIMEKFAKGEIDILVATSVVEVGVNVPNATTIIIEGAERFGLSQLHQLRGRVRRSTHEAYCFLFTESSSPKTWARLKALEESRDGFELAEKDLKLRGPGDLYGTKQWGLSDIGMQALQNIKMVEFARKEALEFVNSDPSLAWANKALLEKINKMEKALHLE